MKQILTSILIYLTTKNFISDEVYLSYNIYGKKHFSSGEGLLPHKLKGNKLKFSIKFNNNANIFIEENPRQINKAFGIREGLIPNKNSVMLGFSTYKDRFELWLFVNHNDKSFESKKIGDFKTNEWIENIIIGIKEDYYYLQHKEEIFKIERNIKIPIPSILGIIRPYFGGKIPNPDKNPIRILVSFK